MIFARRTATALLILLATDLTVILLTGGRSLLGAPAGLAGFLLRAAALALLVVLRFRLLVGEAGRMSGGRLALLLLLLPTLVEFQFHGGRINGDGVMYYVYVRSLLKDFDLDFTNEYTHYGLINRGDLAVPTKTGLRRSIFAIGPAVVWTPFFLLGEGVARAEVLLGIDADLSGYGPEHRNAVALGSLVYGFTAVLLVHTLLRRHFSEATALGGALLAWGATFLHWYIVEQPTMSHATSTFAAAMVLWLWERDRGGRTAWRHSVLGLALGLAMCVRWQNGVLLVLPAFEMWKERVALPRLLGKGGLVLAGTLLGALPQLAAWKALYGEWVLRYPPHGADFLRLDHPFVLETLFSSRHGLLSWTPLFWAGYLGFLPLLRRRPQVGLPLLPPLLFMTYVNMCSGDWWAGGSFSNRRFDSLLPVLAFGFAASIDALRAFLRSRPEAALAAFAVPFVLWNVTLVEQVRRGLVPRDDTVAFPTLVGNGARVFAEAVGSPTTWPASWIFSWQSGRPPGQYDLLVGRYLFYRQNNLGGHVAVGLPGDDAMLGEGWGPIETRDGTPCRRVRGRARLFAPLDVPEDLEVRFRAASAVQSVALVRVNGREAGRIGLEPHWGEARVRVAAPFWRRELNEVAVEAKDSDLCIAGVQFGRLRLPR